MSDRQHVSLEAIPWAYRILLGRDVDDGGFLHYASAMRSGMTVDALISALMSSEEFRRRPHDPTIVDTGNGVLVAFDPEEPEFGRALARNHSWEPHLVNILRQELAAGDVFVDIGANLGAMSFAAASLVGDSGRVISFEPHPDNLYHFYRGLSANSARNVTIYPFALSDREATFSLFGTSNGYLKFDEGGKKACTFIGDQFLASEDKINFIKIDIEGHEPLALKGLDSTIRKHNPRILCEFNPRCLKDHTDISPNSFSDQIFSLTSKAIAIEHDGKSSVVKTSDELMRLWEEKNSEAVSSGHLPEGMLHFDLLFTAEQVTT